MSETTKKRGRKKADVDTKTLVDPIQEVAKESVKESAPEITVESVVETVPETMETKETMEQIEVKETEKETVKETKTADAKTETVVEKKSTPKKKTEKKETVKKEDKKPMIAVGATYTLPFTRIYSSSVAKMPICVCKGDTVIISTDIHDGRINVHNLGTGFIGWIDVTEIK